MQHDLIQDVTALTGNIATVTIHGRTLMVSLTQGLGTPTDAIAEFCDKYFRIVCELICRTFGVSFLSIECSGVKLPTSWAGYHA